MLLDFTNKVVVVTGAGGGLGSVMAANFAASGASVAVCDIKGAEEIAAEIAKNGGKAKAFSFDLTDRDDVKKAVSDITNALGKVDVLVNNAGINVGPDERNTMENFSDTWWDAIIKVDLSGTFNFSKAMVPFINEGGAIINISSVTGMIPLRNQCAFASAKAGVINFSKAMALELSNRKIRVNVVAPGSMRIEITNKLWVDDEAMKNLLAHIPLGRQGIPNEVADAVMYLSSDKASYITGAVLPVDGGWSCGYARDF